MSNKTGTVFQLSYDFVGDKIYEVITQFSRTLLGYKLKPKFEKYEKVVACLLETTDSTPLIQKGSSDHKFLDTLEIFDRWFEPVWQDGDKTITKQESQTMKGKVMPPPPINNGGLQIHQVIMDESSIIDKEQFKGVKPRPFCNHPKAGNNFSAEGESNRERAEEEVNGVQINANQYAYIDKDGKLRSKPINEIVTPEMIIYGKKFMDEGLKNLYLRNDLAKITKELEQTKEELAKYKKWARESFKSNGI